MHYISDRHRSRTLSRVTLLLGTTALTLGAGCDIGWADEIATGDVLLGSNYGVGNFSDGTLIINNGTDVTAPYFVAGAVPGVTGTVTVTGAGTTVTTDDLNIGDAGNGILTISDGASFVTQRARWAVAYGATSSVTVTGAGSSLEIASLANIGDLGNASLTIADGAQVIISSTDSSLVLGVDYYSSGTLNIGAAAGETAVAAGTLDADTVEFGYGTGTIVFNHTNTDYEFDAAITGNGSVLFYSGDTTLTGTSSVSGNTSVYGGTVTVAGSAASYGTAGLSIDGTAGTAMTIENGADVYAGTLNLATSTTNTGTLTVTGDGSSLTAGTLIVGLAGTGSLAIEDGADVDSGLTRIGHDTDSGGAITVTGDGTTFDSGEIYIGYYAPGTLDITDGATVTSDLIAIGYSAYSEGTATASGEGTTWTDAGELFVGFDGTGTLSVEDGADVSATIGYIGYRSHANGTVTVTGDGSSLSLTDLNVGYQGKGSLTIEDGASVSATDVYLGRLADSESTLTVTGEGSTLAAVDRIFVGLGSDATLTIADGASVTSFDGFIGTDPSTEGTVTVTGQGSSWYSSNQIWVGVSGSGALTIADGGAVETTTLYLGGQDGSTGTLNIGAAAGETAVAAGTFVADTVAIIRGTGTIVFNHTDTDYVFAADISTFWPDTGTIDVYSGTTSLTGDLSDFTGLTEIYGGTLSVDTAMTGPITVYDGGTLAGSGTVSDVTLSSGATIAPGNSIGTLTVDGDLTFVSGSTYAVEVDEDGNSDLLDISGAVTIDTGAIVNVSPETVSSSRLGTAYTILTAENGVTGTFTSATDDFAYLSASLSYDANTVYLTLDQSTSDFSSAVTAPNQVAVANAVESLSSGNELYDAVLYLGEDEVSSAFAQLSGEVHADVQASQMSRSSLTRDVVSTRIRDAFDDTGSRYSGLAAYGDDGLNALAARPEKTSFWTSGFGSWSNLDGDGNALGASSDGGGVLFGADRSFGDGWRLGALAGYGQDTLTGAETDATSTIDSYYLGIYGGRSLGPLQLRFGALHAFQEIDSERRVDFSGFDETLSADYHGGTSQAFLEGAWRLDRDLVHLEPFVGLAYTRTSMDAFSETGGSAALSTQAATDQQLVSSLGMRMNRDIAWQGMLGKVSAGLAWNHAFGDLSTEGTYAFAESTSFTISSAAGDRDTAVVNLGLGFDLTETTNLAVSYIGHFGRDTSTNAASAKLGVKF